ncbi:MULTISPECIES: gamma-glutamylcyclotransferase family protein [Flavobacteriaceae]|uniref:gamma-glutamylcyclotransferase family protein n=1 Tax=Flavobacteriaceae TaxID=49546 RepID=UPI0014911A51|nr:MULTISPECIES: gamma-glutamylcyclotransferase family protein [Allomuricauda]MDC6366134.1 gamma-glutamylcyclotransferase [Muricauda sp. AC10]
MNYLFTYGTLQDLQVQQYIFDRILSGRQDHLLGFKRLENAIYDRYPLVIQTNDTIDKVMGMIYEVTEEDLRRADIYETNAYTRNLFLLESGIEAWVYVKNSE